MNLPLLLTPEQLAAHLGDDNLLILDLSAPQRYAEGHVPGAVNLDPQRLLRGTPPVPNLLPTETQLSDLFSELGLTPDTHVVAYDDQMGPWAGRLIWTLDVVGHHRASVLDGQLPAWESAGQPLETVPNFTEPQPFQARIDPDLVADKAYLLAHLDAPQVKVWDARSAEEYRGEKRVNAHKAGHIPGAIHLEWTDTLVGTTDWRLKGPQALAELLASRGLHPDQELVMHCQTHRRSGLTYLAAKSLGYPRLRCYDGSWFEWGNAPDTPVATDE
ncbi:sulfurtransferase [Motiliproteus sp. SC1-56]|uniref:sulfurtransferase n=1 Tax=Motiliproteus sp. SC1-56 TaxID=2799565 RepID=UPI001A8CBCA3|nr:sulfurtransferase [Motiliproteus sp. SC1-56]